MTSAKTPKAMISCMDNYNSSVISLPATSLFPSHLAPFPLIEFYLKYKCDYDGLNLHNGSIIYNLKPKFLLLKNQFKKCNRDTGETSLLPQADFLLYVLVLKLLASELLEYRA